MAAGVKIKTPKINVYKGAAHRGITIRSGASIQGCEYRNGARGPVPPRGRKLPVGGGLP